MAKIARAKRPRICRNDALRDALEQKQEARS
jgi:hypothetical protein